MCVPPPLIIVVGVTYLLLELQFVDESHVMCTVTSVRKVTGVVVESCPFVTTVHRG